MEGVDSMVAFGGAVAVAALVEVVKRMAKLPSDLEDRVYPAFALLVGICWNWLVLNYLRAEDQRASTIVLAGLMSGLMASGIWSQAMATVRSFQEKPKPAPRG